MNKIEELFKDEKTVYIFDIDGVLASLEYGDYNHYYYDDEEWAKMVMEQNFYHDIRAFETMQKFLEPIDKERVYVATKVMNDEEWIQKKNFVEKNYGIKPSHVYSVLNNNDKLKVMKQIHQMYPALEDKYLVMIDDTVDVLNNIMEHSNYSTVHISSFIE